MAGRRRAVLGCREGGDHARTMGRRPCSDTDRELPETLPGTLPETLPGDLARGGPGPGRPGQGLAGGPQAKLSFSNSQKDRRDAIFDPSGVTL